MVNAARPQEAPKRILVVEDEALIAGDIRQSLKEMGYSVIGTVASGEEAVERAIKEKPDLILMDIVLQGKMDGTEAAEKILSKFDVPIIYITAYANDNILERARVTGPFGYMIKPFESSELRFSIEMALYKHKMEKELKRQNEFINVILNSLTHPLYVINANDYTIELANPAANLGNLSGVKCHALTHHSDMPCSGAEHPCTIAEIKKQKKAVMVEHTHYDKDGNAREVEVHGYPIFDEEGNVAKIVEYTLDITERKQLERQFLESQKLESVGRLASGVAHDFNNIMSAVLGYSEMALMDIPLDHPAAEKLQIIREAGEKAAALTRQLLAFSSKQTLNMKPVSLKSIVEDMVKMLGRMIGEQVVLEVEAEEGTSNIMADRGQIEQVLMNLAVNAKDAMPDGGRLTISVRSKFVEAAARGNADLSAGPYVELSVADTGTGMSREVREKAFEPFFTTKQLGVGTGLGLSTVYGIIKQHKGHISLRSAPGRGTTFDILLPAVSGEAIEAAPARLVSLPHGAETVLVVDDEPAILMLVNDALTPLGYSVLKASGADEAFKAAEGRKIDLLITDIVMPGLNGLELSRALKETLPAIRVLFMSGYKDFSISPDASEITDRNFIQKPLRPSVLAQAVRDALDGKGRAEE